MSKALSVDLRERVVAAVTAGLSCQAAAVRLGVSAASAVRVGSADTKSGFGRAWTCFALERFCRRTACLCRAAWR